MDEQDYINETAPVNIEQDEIPEPETIPAQDEIPKQDVIPAPEEIAPESTPVQEYATQPSFPAQTGYAVRGGAPYVGGMSPVQREPDSAAEDKMSSAYKRVGFGTLALFQIYQTIGTATLVIGIILFVMLTVVGPYFRGEVIPELSPGDVPSVMMLASEDPKMLVVTGLFALGSAAGMIVAILVFKLILSKRHFEAIPQRDLTAGQFWLVVLTSFALWGIGVYLGNFPQLLFPTGPDLMTELMEQMGVNGIPIHLYAVFGAPILEELALRKVLLDRIHKYGGLPAAVVSGLLFGLIHGNSGQFIFAFFLGMIFAAVYLYTGRILYPIMLHFMINFTASTPDLLYMAGIDISLAFTVAVGVIGVAGLPFAIMAFRRSKVFKPTPAVFEQPERLVVRNPGMLLCLIFFSASLVLTDFLLVGQRVLNYGVIHMIGFVPTMFSVVIILTAIFYLNSTYKAQE